MLRDMIDVRNAVPHYFSRSTMRFFNSRIESKLIEGRFFVTSEQYNATEPRLFSVREVVTYPPAAFGIVPKVSIKTLGQFQGYQSRREALEAAKQAALEAMPELQPA